MKRVRLFTAILFTVALATMLSSCKKEDDVIVYGNAKFKLVNAVQGSATQDFYQGDTKINTTALDYGETSDYLTVKAGNSTVSFKSATNQMVSASGNIGVNTDVNYTVFFAKNAIGTNEITGYPELVATPPAGRAGVRFVNLGGNLTSAILVSLATGGPITTNLNFGAITDYAVLDPSVEHKFSLINTPTISTAIPVGTFQAGKLYTVWFDSSNSTTAQYHVVVQN